MSKDYPLIVVQDRYNGVYSGGAWFAVARANDAVDGNMTRAQFCLTGDDGPSDSDVEAATFWRDPPQWIAAGRTPDEAVKALRKKLPFEEARPNRRVLKIFKEMKK